MQSTKRRGQAPAAGLTTGTDKACSAAAAGAGNMPYLTESFMVIKNVLKYHLTLQQPCETAMTAPHFTYEEIKPSMG